MKKKLIAYGVTTVAGLLIVLWVVNSQGLFQIAGTYSKEAMSILSDGFFTSGAIILMLGLLVWIATTGFFDSIAYFGHVALHAIFPTRLDKKKSYYDYKLEKEEKRVNSPMFMIVVGGVLVAVSAVFAILFSNM